MKLHYGAVVHYAHPMFFLLFIAVNKSGGERGDTSIVEGGDSKGKRSRGSSFLPGLGRNRDESATR
jgi:hypothetical protein